MVLWFQDKDCNRLVTILNRGGEAEIRARGPPTRPLQPALHCPLWFAWGEGYARARTGRRGALPGTNSAGHCLRERGRR